MSLTGIGKRLNTFLRCHTEDTGLPLAHLLMASGVLHLIVAVLAVNPWHPDEHFQILEPAWARAGLAPMDELAWEFNDRIRPTLQPTLALILLTALRAVGLTSPFLWVLLLKLGTLALSMVTVIWIVSAVSRSLDRPGRRALWLTSLFLWVLPLFHHRFSSENLAGMAFFAAVPLIVRPGRVRSTCAGILLGLAFLFRFQMAFAIIALITWSAVRGRGRLKRLGQAVAIAGTVVALSIVLDSWFYGEWVLTPWAYFEANVLEGVAASFGTSPWYFYPVQLVLWTVPPLGLVLGLLLVGAVLLRPGSPWVWCSVAFFVGHSAIGHKELRFLLPLLYALPVLVGYSVSALDRSWSAGRWRRGFVWTLVAQNVVLLAILATPAIHRGKEFDWHYFRALWQVSERAAGAPVYVLDTLEDPYEVVTGLSTNIYRHPSVQAARMEVGTPPKDLVPPDVGSDRLLLVTRTESPPALPGVATLGLIYEAEAGYVRMARPLGLRTAGFITWLEMVDRWTVSDWKRKVYEVWLEAGE
jgi:phosphatidylinositol glycan class B